MQRRPRSAPTRRRWLAGAAGAAALGLAGCARRRSDELRLWAMGREGEVVGELLPDFLRAHPGVRVRVEQLPWSAAHEKLLTAFAGNALPDLAQLGNTWLPEFVALGALEPLDAHLRSAEGLDKADYFEGIWSTNVIDGQTWGLPWYVDTRVLFYRRDLLQAAGHERIATTWEGWQRQLHDLKARAGAQGYAVLLPTNEYDPLVAFALQGGEPLLRDGGRWGAFRGEGFRRTWRFFHGLYAAGLAPPVSHNEVANVWNEFARGYFACYISGPWQIGEFRRRLPPALQQAWATAPLPGPQGPGASIAGGSSLAIFRRSAHKPAAWALARHLSQPAVQQRFHALTGNLPPRRSAWGPALLADAPTAAFRDQLERVRPVPQVPEWERLATELRILLERVVHGQLAPERLPDEMDRQADRLLDKRRWMLARHGVAT